MLQRKAVKSLVIRIDNISQILSEMDLSTFQHFHRIEPGRLDQFHLYVRIAPRI